MHPHKTSMTGYSGLAAGARTLLVAPPLLMALAAPLHANPLFSASFLSFDVGGYPVSVATADLNGDGRPDLALANAGAYSYHSGTVSAMLGNGDGTFAARTDFGSLIGPTSVAIADLNNDGRSDLAVVSTASNTVSVLPGNGDGTFGAKTDFDTGADPRSIAVADLNADGWPDLAVVNTGSYPDYSGTVSVLLGNGDGTFGAKTDFGTGWGPRSVAIADLNADGHADLAVTCFDSQAVSVLLGNGDGTFAARTDFATGSDPLSMAIADLNGDGRPDLAVVNLYPSLVSVLLGNGDGTFGPRTYFFLGIESRPQSVAIADLNADGRPDLAVTNGGAHTVSVLLGNGDGRFAARTEFGTGSGACSMAIADFDTDGRLDLAIANTTAHMISVLLGNGDGTFGAMTDFGTGSHPSSLAIADLNGDGRPDLGVASYSSNTLSVLLGNGNGTFGAKTDFDTGADPRSIAVADLNADGWPDLAVVNTGSYPDYSGTVSVLLGNGDGTFGAKTDFGTGSGPRSVAIADLNADGKPDLVVAGSSFWPVVSSSVSVLLGNGDGSFGAATDFSVIGYWTSSVAIADLNGDGRPDLAVASAIPAYVDDSGGDHPPSCWGPCPGEGRVSVLLGNGDGTFGAPTGFATGYGPLSVAVADLDSDGRPDLAVANADSRSRSVSVLLGNGNGTFGAKTDFGTGFGPASVAIADLNADGRPDLAVANAGAENDLWPNYPNTVSVLLGNGDGTFAAKADFGTGSSPRSVAIADLDMDGRPDLAVANNGSNTVSVLLNHGATPPPVAMGFDFTPGTLNLASHALRVTGYLEPAPPFAAGDIDIASIRLNGTVPVDPAAPTALGDHDGNGVPDLMVKFNRLAVELTVAEGDDVPVTVTGTVDGHSFSGTDHIRVRRAVVSAPAAGGHLTAGSVTEVRWQTPDGVVAQSAALMFSPDGGGTWSLIEGGQTNTGSYSWTVPDLPTDQAKVAVVLVESADAGGDVVEGVLGVSEAFSIAGVVGVGDRGPAPLALAIQVVSPNPSADGRLLVEFALRDGSSARLELVDVAGRAVTSRAVGSLGPGIHSIDLSQRDGLRAGVYFLRLTQGGSEARARAAVLR